MSIIQSAADGTGHPITSLREHRYWIIGATAIAVVLAFGLFEFLTAPRIEAVNPGPDAYAATNSLTVTVDMRGADRLHGLSVRLDDRDITPNVRVDKNRLFFTSGKLDEGEHIVTLRAKTSNILRPNIAKTWHFVVDTVTPRVAVVKPRMGGAITTLPVTVSGTTEPLATVTGTAGSISGSTTAGSDGRFALPLKLKDGPVNLHVKAVDGAGNSASADSRFTVDLNPPTLLVDGVGRTVKTARPRLRIIASDDAGPTIVRTRLDGEIVAIRSSSSQLDLPLDTLPEGKHSLVVTATDKGGHVVDYDTTFLVNSTERLGKAVLIFGAKGKDVRELQRLLKKQGAYRGRLTTVYDRKTENAVERFQESIDMEPDGITGPMVLSALQGRIVIDQSECKLYLYIEGALKRVFPVAVGQPAYPTPNGTFHIVWMQRNPTWIPPDSPWAQGLEPIPPGPGNPVGTRWIGTSAEGVGMHGTPDDASIGQHASHGCIRMHMGDVEQLFEWVSVGMPVIIRP